MSRTTVVPSDVMRLSVLALNLLWLYLDLQIRQWVLNVAQHYVALIVE